MRTFLSDISKQRTFHWRKYFNFLRPNDAYKSVNKVIIGSDNGLSSIAYCMIQMIIVIFHSNFYRIFVEYHTMESCQFVQLLASHRISKKLFSTQYHEAIIWYTLISYGNRYKLSGVNALNPRSTGCQLASISKHILVNTNMVFLFRIH